MTVVAIDGPAGAGKSSVARAVADRLGFTYLDSGAMYRCVALAALRRGTGAGRGRHRGVALARRPRAARRRGRDRRDPCTRGLRGRLGRRRRPGVRTAMVAEQRRLLATGDWVAEGRDIGTVVWPSAEVKVFLTASPAARAGRRAEQIGADVAVVLAEQAIRDQRDIERDESPLRRRRRRGHRRHERPHPRRGRRAGRRAGAGGDALTRMHPAAGCAPRRGVCPAAGGCARRRGGVPGGGGVCPAAGRCARRRGGVPGGGEERI